jgi:poly(3-hydroxybutyrate) depolymerase
MSGEQQNNNTRMRALGREHGYIVVQPNATPAPPLADWTALDDAAVLDFGERAAAAFHVDPRRWYFTGFSQGGFMSWRFACKYADRFAAIAPLAGCSYGGANACLLDQVAELPGETHILYSHGSLDTIVSGSCMGPQRDQVLNAYDLGDPEVLSTDAKHTRTRWTNPRGITFELIEHDYAAANTVIGGHCFAGSDDPGGAPGQYASYACAGQTAYDWGNAVVEFFDAHVRPE